MKRRSETGVSLVEATIMLAVAGIISAAAAPVVSRTIDRTRLSRAQTDALAISTGINNLLAEHTGFSPFTINGLTGGTTVGMLVGDGDIPELGIGGTASWTAQVNVAAAPPVDYLERHLLTNTPGGTGAYTTTGLVPWRGAYLNGPVDPDPWGNRYAVNVLYLRTAPTSNDVVVLSGGPDEAVNTPFAANGIVAGGDDIFAIVRRDLGRTVSQ